MRTNEQFKLYVYEKANEKRISQKHNRAVFVRGLAAFSLLFIISGALVYGNFTNKTQSEAATSAVYENKENGKGFYNFSKSVLTDDAINESVLVVADGAQLIAQNEANDAFEIQDFSFKNDVADLKYETEAETAIAGTGAVSTEEAIEIAKDKCTIDYNMTDVFYDSDDALWKIVFYTQNTAGNCQTVYLNYDGSVRLIVYGE